MNNAMSLFPAYENHEKPGTSEECEIEESNGADKDSAEWLENSSFVIKFPEMGGNIEISLEPLDESDEMLPAPLEQSFQVFSLDSDSSCDEPQILTERPKTLTLKKHSARTKPKVTYQLDVKNVYYEDKKRQIGNCFYTILPAKARSTYDLKHHCTLGFRLHDLQPKKEIITRYYSADGDSTEKKMKPNSVIKRGAPITSDGHETNCLALLDSMPNAEDEEKSLTREFNRKLTASPYDVDLWLGYVKFQDIAHRFENSHCRENKMAICEKKLSILERGLEKNADSKELLREKLQLMSELYPADQFANRIEALVNRDTSNTLLWQTYILATQYSVAMCTVPKIINMYTKCFGTLRLWPRTSSRNYDQRLLEMLHHCLVFLRQAGMWEQMWETLRLNLTLNLNLAKDTLRFQGSIDEKKLIELEEVILTSRLPLNQLWLRVESLRENSHWISVDRDQLELIGDSHRFVSPEDVTDFVHPMLTRDSNMRLAIYALITLKVPLLPTSDTILRDLGLSKCGWTIDSIESILAMLYPALGEAAGHKERKLLLTGLLAGDLTSGPQYLRYHPAQEPYRDFIRETFRAIADSLSPLERTSLYVWWLRFERMLVYLCRDEPKSDARRKKLKGILKEFLKRTENRNNLHYYREYALIEREMGLYDSCVNILEMAIESATITNEEEYTAVMSLRRTLVEVLLKVKYYNATKKHRVNRVLCQLVPGEPQKNHIELVEAHLREFLDNFLSETQVHQMDTIQAHFLPNFICDNVACYAYLLYVNERDISEILTIYDACLQHTRGISYLQERFYENLIIILQIMYERFPGIYNIFVKRLNDALSCYPDNFYLLSVFAGIEIRLPTWKLSVRKENDGPWKALALCLAGRARIISFMELGVTHAMNAAVNKLYYFHRRIAKSPETQHCPLIWRLLMLVLREQELSQERGEETYHESVAQCPWSRSIYIDAAEVAPQVLTQIQDVIREKDLRMHVTPEELDILRG